MKGVDKRGGGEADRSGRQEQITKAGGPREVNWVLF